MSLLFINALKGLKKKKVQMLGIVLLVFLGTAIYTTMNLSLDRMEEKYYDYIESQNVQDFGMTPNIDFKTDYTYDEINTILKDNPNLDESYKYLINMYAECLKTGKSNCLKDELLENINGIFIINNLNKNKYEEKLIALSQKYDFNCEYQQSKSIINGKYSSVIFPLKEKIINKPYLLEGSEPKNDNEITVLKLFAEANNLNIGDNYKINNTEYEIVGYMYASDYIYPMMSITNPMYDYKYNNVIFTTENSFENMNGIVQNDYVGRFSSRETVDQNFRDLFNLNFENLEGTSKEKSEASLSMSGMLSLMRTRQPKMEFKTNRLFAEYFMYFLLSICVLVILIITKKRIDDERLQIGVLKSLGYKSMAIATSYLVYPIMGSIIGGVLGYLLGYLLNPLLTNTYKLYYCFPIGSNLINLKYLSADIFIPMISLSILSFLVALFMLRKKPLYLLKEGSNLKVNLLTKFTNFVTKRMPFNNRFKYSMASRSLGKLIIIFITAFASGMLIILTLIGMNLFNSMIDKMLNRYHFNYQLTYHIPQDKADENSDLLYSVMMKTESNDESYDLNVMGVDADMDAMDLTDDKGKSIISQLELNDVIISRPVSEVIGIEVGDVINLKYNNNVYSYKVKAIYEDYFNMGVVVNKNYFASQLGISNKLYNIKLSQENDYDKLYNSLDKNELSQISSILSLDQLKSNMDSAMKQFNASMYIVVAFASLMSFIIIAVIANIVVEENKRTISLMKVMGYHNKVISKIVLNIYTPFIVIAYFLSIPITIAILKSIVKALTGDMNMSIPITLSWQNALIGLIGLLIAYYIAIMLSKKVLNKVPLAVALKRE